MALVTPVVPPTRRNVELALLLFAIAVAEAAYAIVGLTVQGAVPRDWWLVGGGFALIVLAVHGLLRWRARYADPVILPIATVLNGLGLVMIHRLDLAHHFNKSTSLATRQLPWSAIGVACAIAVIRAPHLAQRFRGRGEPYDDLVQVGTKQARHAKQENSGTAPSWRLSVEGQLHVGPRPAAAGSWPPPASMDDTRARQEAAIPLPAALERPLLAEVVDVDEPEPARVTPRPFEVVHQRPHEVALEWQPLLQRRGAGENVLLEVAPPRLVLHLAVDDGVRIGRAVLGDVQGQVRSVGMRHLQHVDHALRVDRPAHLRARCARVDELQALAAGIGPPGRLREHRGAHGRVGDDMSAVVVDAEEVDRRRYVRGVRCRMLGEPLGLAQVGEHILRVSTGEHRLQEEPVDQTVDATHGPAVRLRVRSGPHRVQVEGDADGRLRSAGVDLRNGAPVPEEQVVSRTRRL